MWSAAEMWKRVTTGRYTRELEKELGRVRAENSRIRDENRALLNSVLGVAGLPPISVGAADLAAGLQTAAAPAQPRAKTTARNLRSAAPMRRRSWHQVHRILEIQAARKKSEDA
jgi:hypothetical protein